MKLYSWNVNGIRAVMKKGFLEFLKEYSPDILCLQEIKATKEQIELDLEEYNCYINSAEKKGYSGTAVFSKIKPISVIYGMNKKEHLGEGRIITLEYDNFFLVNVYTPNSKRGLKRLDYRQIWDNDFLEYLKKLELKKPVIFCGDLNVAHNEIDIKNPNSNHKNAGFTDEERDDFTKILNSGFIDTFRYFYPNKENAYTWWSYMFNARSKNIGWRLDYFCVSDVLKEKLNDSIILDQVYGSDHCPICLDININN